jgi:hypothetical protein
VNNRLLRFTIYEIELPAFLAALLMKRAATHAAENDACVIVLGVARCYIQS